MNAKQLTRLKVTGTYLSIIMLMSIIFSFTIYYISENELASQRRVEVPKGMRAIIQIDEFDNLRETQLQQARENLREKLITFNLLTLIAGSFLSYALAIRSLRPIEEALERQDRFTSDASHEIRTPLTAMRSEIEVTLRDKKLSVKDAKQTLESNLEEINRLETLTAGLLSLARQENNEIYKQKINLNEIIQKACDQLAPLSKQKLISIKTSLPKRLNALGDPTSLSQAIVILVDNAIKYSPSGSDINVTAKSTRNNYEITVSDSGSGIPAHDLPHIFDRFYRSDKSRTKDSQKNGYGLGLAIAKQIIHDHSGEITIRSGEDLGTTVKITLPKK